MAYTLLRAQGYEVGESRVEHDQLQLAEKLIAEAELRKVEFLLPMDHVIVEKGAPEKPPRVVRMETFSPSGMGMDIGPETVKLYSSKIATARMVIWNGPVGVFEKPPFDQGTIGIARALAECRGTTIIGGGDSIAAVHHAGVADRISHLSTGGGATLEFLAGIELPGVRALSEKN
jgi:phosphoglycerate kinase